jgi:hypothetical protein
MNCSTHSMGLEVTVEVLDVSLDDVGSSLI